MKKTIANFTALHTVSVLAVSCQKGLFAEFLSFTASHNAGTTKTYLDGVQVKWQETDSIKIWYGTAGTGNWKLIDATPGITNGASKGDIPQN